MLVIFFLAGIGVFSYSRVSMGMTERQRQETAPVSKDSAAKEDDKEKAYVTDHSIIAYGTAPIRNNTAQGRALARRAAVTDARRNILLLRPNMRNSSFFSGVNASGSIGAHGIRSERAEGNMYKVEIEMPLGKD
ncbi:hypothetical protein FACS1894167_10950 [Synergistales bacterium]|nr:hypothetical protein FACS1894167_10950 [Synergistales bacterium]